MYTDDLEEQREAINSAADRDRNDFLWLMGDERGRRFIWQLLGITGVFQSSFTGDNATFFREGARNVGLQLLTKIHTLCPEKYSIMTKEQQDHANRIASNRKRK